MVPRERGRELLQVRDQLGRARRLLLEREALGQRADVSAIAELLQADHLGDWAEGDVVVHLALDQLAALLDRTDHLGDRAARLRLLGLLRPLVEALVRCGTQPADPRDLVRLGHDHDLRETGLDDGLRDLPVDGLVGVH